MPAIDVTYRMSTCVANFMLVSVILHKNTALSYIPYKIYFFFKRVGTRHPCLKIWPHPRLPKDF